MLLPMTHVETDQDSGYPNPRYAWYVVSVLTVAYLLSFLDRQILALLVEPIRRDLDISDTQVSLLGNLAFGIFYTLLGPASGPGGRPVQPAGHHRRRRGHRGA